MEKRFDIEIGSDDWANRIREFTNSFDRSYWQAFSAWTEVELKECEIKVNRQFPVDFKEFLLEFGSGNFPFQCGGDIYTAEEIIAATPGPMWMALGTADLASDEDYQRLYSSRGKHDSLRSNNSMPDFVFDGISLFDVLQIGTDGNCCYHQINVSEGATDLPFGYCLLTSDPTFENKLPSFSAGLSLILSFHAACARGDERAVYFRDFRRE